MSLRQSGWGKQKPPRGAHLNRAHPLAQGLVSRWLFNENGGPSVYDLTGRRNTGALTNGPTWVAGAFSGYALNFTGASQYVVINPFSTVLTSLTVAIWIKTSAVAEQVILALNRYVGVNAYKYEFVLEMNSTGTVTFWDYADAANGFATTQHTNAVINDGRWHHVAFVKNGTAGAYYIDGVADATATAASNVTYGTNYFAVGANIRDSNLYLTGAVDNIAVYSRPLTPNEILWLYSEPFVDIHPPSPRLLYFLQSAAPGGGFQSAWAVNSTVTIQPGAQIL